MEHILICFIYFFKWSSFSIKRFSLKDSVGRQWTLIWHANIQSKDKISFNTQFFFCFPPFLYCGHYTRMFTSIHAKIKNTKQRAKRKQQNENNTQIVQDLQVFFFLLTNRLFGKTDKHLTKCLTFSSSLVVWLLFSVVWIFVSFWFI